MLDWHELEERHQRLLQTFRCAKPERHVYDPRRGVKGLYHPFEHEIETQSWLRDLRPRDDGESTTQLGFLGGNLASVLRMCVARDNHGSGEQYFLIQAMGVDVNLRGIGAGDATITQALAIADSTNRKFQSCLAPEDYPVPVVARIWEKNIPSQGLFARHGFVKDAEIEPGLWRWLWI